MAVIFTSPEYSVANKVTQSGSSVTAPSFTWYFKYTIDVVSQNISNNTSVLRYTMYWKTSKTSSTTIWANTADSLIAKYTIKIGGSVNKEFKKTIGTSSGACTYKADWYEQFNETVTVAHNNDGSLTLPSNIIITAGSGLYSGPYGPKAYTSATENVVITRIPRASTITTNTRSLVGQLDDTNNKLVITKTNKSGLVDELSYTIKDSIGTAIKTTVLEDASTASSTNTITWQTIVTAIQDATTPIIKSWSGSMEVICTTYSDATKTSVIGSPTSISCTIFIKVGTAGEGFDGIALSLIDAGDSKTGVSLNGSATVINSVAKRPFVTATAGQGDHLTIPNTLGTATTAEIRRLVNIQNIVTVHLEAVVDPADCTAAGVTVFTGTWPVTKTGGSVIYVPDMKIGTVLTNDNVIMSFSVNNSGDVIINYVAGTLPTSAFTVRGGLTYIVPLDVMPD